MFTADTKEFTVNIDAFVQKAKGRAQLFASEFVQDIGEQVIEATPVKTGFLRASWYASINAQDVVSGPSSPKSGGALAASLGFVGGAEFKLGDMFYMNNGATYAMRVEFGFVGTDALGRKYNQAPRSFVRSTLDRAASIAEETAQRVAAL